MGRLLSDELIATVLERSDIVEVVSGYLSLKKTGSRYRGLCPFHSEKTPSFMVSEEKQVFHCFGCGVGGNVYQFLMKYEQIDFPQAVRMLAERAGVTVNEWRHQPPRSEVGEGELEGWRRVQEAAAHFFQEQLFHPTGGGQARIYLQSRGLTIETMRQFGLGYAPVGWDHLLRAMVQQGYSVSQLERTGLVKARRSGTGYYDRFRGRIIFPICDLQGRVIGFGGRIIDAEKPDEPKYLNSPETPLYQKGKVLYGLNVARPEIQRARAALIVEGYFDLLTLYQNGFRHTVATLGTALTATHFHLLRRFTQRIFFVFDQDTAGQAATQRGGLMIAEQLSSGDLRGTDRPSDHILKIMEGSRQEKLEVRVVTLPPGTDVDAFVRQEGAGAFGERLAQAQGLLDFMMSHALAAYPTPLTFNDRIQIVEEVVPLLLKMDDLECRHSIRTLAIRLDVGEDIVAQVVARGRGGIRANGFDRLHSGSGSSLTRASLDSAEETLVNLLLNCPDLVHQAQQRLLVDDVEDQALRRIVQVMFEFCNLGKAMNRATILQHLGQDSGKDLAAKMLVAEGDLGEPRVVLHDCINRILSRKIKRRFKQLQAQICEQERTGQIAQLNKLLEEKALLRQQLSRLQRQAGPQGGSLLSSEVQA